MRQHPALSRRILEPISTFAGVAELAACHHERLDRTGYFRGRDAESLGHGARSVERALEVMRHSAGEHLASDLIEAIPDIGLQLRVHMRRVFTPRNDEMERPNSRVT
ncbi:MAG: HD domain-containing phosphohydrolase [Candidatus Limnocylindria bacterium]